MKSLKVVLPFLLAASVLTTGSPSASALPADGYYGCNSGRYESSSSVSNSYRILSGELRFGVECGGDVFIADGVTSIGNDAFSFHYRNPITSVRIPNTVTSIGYFAFENTSSLTTVTFEVGSQLDLIKDFAFFGSGIRSIILPSTVTRIQDGAFYNTRLTSLSIPNSVTSIGNYAFYNTTSLTQYSYCGTMLSQSTLDMAGLSGKTNLCAIVTPVITSNSVSSITPTTATLNATSSVAGTAYLLTLSASTSAPTANTVVSTGASQSVSQGANTVSLSSLTPSTSYVAYLVVRHSSGGQSLVSATSFTTLGSGISPLFSSASSYDGRFTVQIKDYDEAFTYAVTSTVGQASINSKGLITVAGLRPDQSVTVDVTTTRTGYASGSGSVTGRSQVAPMLPGTKPVVEITDTTITCTIGSHSATPTSAAFSLFVDGKHVSTIFSALGEYLPDWIIPWATSSSITRTASLTSATWTMSDAYKGKAITCGTLAYSKNAIGFTASQVMVAR
jgi:hypothetical protein